MVALNSLTLNRKMSLLAWLTRTITIQVPSWTIWLAIIIYFVNIKSVLFSWTIQFYTLVGRHFYYAKLIPKPIRSLIFNIFGIPKRTKVLVEPEQIRQLMATEKLNGDGVNNKIVDGATGLDSRIVKITSTDKPQAWELFGDHVFETAASPLECDVNFHKSNSTYFTDLDIARSDLVCRVFKQALVEHRAKSGKWLYVALGSVACVFKKEIKPMQKYNIESRVLGWDDKWIVVRSRFVTGGRNNNVMAIAVSKYVFKEGRKTVPPIDVINWCGYINDSNRDFINQTAAKGFEVFQNFLNMEATLPIV